MQIYGISTASHRQNYTSLYSFDCEFRQSRNIAFDKTSGIRAAAQRIISAMDGGAYMQHRVCYNKLDVQKYTRTYIFERACALFSANSLYLRRLFAKALEIWHILVSTRSICQSAGVPAVLH